MATFDLFSKRTRRERGEEPDVYSYDKLPESVRVQILHILREALGLAWQFSQGHRAIGAIINILRKERGVFRLAGIHDSGTEELSNYFLSEGDVEKAFDVIELVFMYIDREVRGNESAFSSEVKADEAIEELNDRLQESAIGYRYEDGLVVRVDNKVVHQEAVKPALRLLSGEMYSGANDEFRRAHEHYRSGNSKEAINECLKAFESTLKAICKKRGWEFKSSDTAKRLIDIALSNGLLPTYLQTQLGSFRSLLESGVPTVRNKTSGHGQGDTVTAPPGYLAGYVIALAATSISLLANANEDTAGNLSPQQSLRP